MSVGYSEEESEQIQQEADPRAGGTPPPPPPKEKTWLEKVHDDGISPETKAQWEAYHAEYEAAQAAYAEQQEAIARGDLIEGTITTTTYADPEIQAEFEPTVVPQSVEEQRVLYVAPPDPYREFAEYGGGQYVTEEGDVVSDVGAVRAFQEDFDSEDAYEYKKSVQYPEVTLYEALTEAEFNPQSVMSQDFGPRYAGTDTATYIKETSPGYQSYLEALEDRRIKERSEALQREVAGPQERYLSPSDRQEYFEFGEADAPFISYLEEQARLQPEYETRPSINQPWYGNPLENAGVEDFYIEQHWSEYSPLHFLESGQPSPDQRTDLTKYNLETLEPYQEFVPSRLSTAQTKALLEKRKQEELLNPINAWALEMRQMVREGRDIFDDIMPRPKPVYTADLDTDPEFNPEAYQIEQSVLGYLQERDRNIPTYQFEPEPTSTLVPELAVEGVAGTGYMIGSSYYDLQLIAQGVDLEDIVYESRGYWKGDAGGNPVFWQAGQEKEILDEFGETKIVDWDFGVETTEELYGEKGKFPSAAARMGPTQAMETVEFYDSDLGKEVIEYERSLTKNVWFSPAIDESIQEFERQKAQDPIKAYGRLGGQLIFFTGGMAALSKVPVVGKALTKPLVTVVQPFEELATFTLEKIPGFKKAAGGKVDWEEMTYASMQNLFRDLKDPKRGMWMDRLDDPDIGLGKRSYWAGRKRFRAEDSERENIAAEAENELDKIDIESEFIYFEREGGREIRELTIENLETALEWEGEQELEDYFIEVEREGLREFESEMEREREREPETERERERERERDREREPETEIEWEPPEYPDEEIEEFDDYGVDWLTKYEKVDILNPVVRDIDKAIDDILKGV